MANVEETELRQHLHDVEQERDQVAARDPGRAVQLEEEVCRLAQIIDDMQVLSQLCFLYHSRARPSRDSGNTLHLWG